MIKQQQALIATEGVDLIFTDPAIRRISEVAEEVNTLVDNIGARRLHTILERILEDISFNAPEEVIVCVYYAVSGSHKFSSCMCLQLQQPPNVNKLQEVLALATLWDA